MKLFEAELVITHHTWAWLAILCCNLVWASNCWGAERFDWLLTTTLASSLVLYVLTEGGHREHQGASPAVELVRAVLSPSLRDLFVEVWEKEKVELCPVQFLHHVFSVWKQPVDCPVWGSLPSWPARTATTAPVKRTNWFAAVFKMIFTLKTCQYVSGKTWTEIGYYKILFTRLFSSCSQNRERSSLQWSFIQSRMKTKYKTS